MATEFRLPEVGENVESGQVVKLLVSVGDTIEPNQSILELETDKAVVEVPSRVSGMVKEIHVEEGDELKVGELILTVEEAGEGAQEAAPEPEAAAEAAAEDPAPKGVGEVRVAREVEQPPEGRAEAPKEAKRAPARKPAPEEKAEPEDIGETDLSREIAPAAPSVRRMARELGVDINEVKGSGPGGRISGDDVKEFVRQTRSRDGAGARPQPAVAPVEALPLPDFTRWGEVEREKMSGVRRTTARRLGQAWSTIPHVTNFDQADITELEQMRKQYGDRAQAAGGKLTVTAILLKVIASALKVFPKLNASIDMANEEIIYKKYYHIGVAVDTERGLLVPVIRDVDRKNLTQLSVELTEIAERARNRKVSPEDLEGSNFAITNLGGIGGTNFTPIINPPNVAILGVSRASMQPIFKDGSFEPRLILPLSLSYDHRLVDGADAARFLRWVSQTLEQPFLLAMEG
jgi:pyruvate dehydrogenase E2 component (dihydrolipoamide acetyltransferase)